MSNATPLLLGLAGGLALWRLVPSDRPALRNAGSSMCVIQLEPNGVVVDGAVVEIEDAVRGAQAAGFAVVSVAPDAPASLYGALLHALRVAGVPTHTRATGVSVRNAGSETFSAFTLVTYPEGVGGSGKTMSWFRTDAPMTWRAARDQLAAAKIIDPSAIAPNQAGYWKLVTDPRVFMPMRATPMPESAARNSYISTTFTLVVYPEGVGGPKQTRWFRASQPTMWDAARDRLAAAGLLDANANKPTDPGYWILVSSANAFRETEAEPLPGRAKRTRDARAAARYTLDGGRVILRDGQPVVRLERVDLGDSRYVLSPHETDELGAKIVRLLNRRGAR